MSQTPEAKGAAMAEVVCEAIRATLAPLALRITRLEVLADAQDTQLQRIAAGMTGDGFSADAIEETLAWCREHYRTGVHSRED